LDDLAKHADYYGANPAASETLDGILLRSPDLIDELPNDDGFRCLLLGFKLRNEVLFKESLVHAANAWFVNKNGFPTLLEPHRELRRTVILACIRIYDNKKLYYDYLMNSTAWGTHRVRDGGPDLSPEEMRTIERSKITIELAQLRVRNPVVVKQASFVITDRPPFFRALYEDLQKENPYFWSRPRDLYAAAAEGLTATLSPLMENNLVLDRSGEGAGQMGRYREAFCAQRLRTTTCLGIQSRETFDLQLKMRERYT